MFQTETYFKEQVYKSEAMPLASTVNCLVTPINLASFKTGFAS